LPVEVPSCDAPLVVPVPVVAVVVDVSVVVVVSLLPLVPDVLPLELPPVEPLVELAGAAGTALFACVKALTLTRLDRAAIAAGAPSMGATVAFDSLLSMAPLLLQAIAIPGLVIVSDVARHLLLDRLTQLVGEKGSAAVLTMREAPDHRTTRIVAALVSIGTLI